MFNAVKKADSGRHLSDPHKLDAWPTHLVVQTTCEMFTYQSKAERGGDAFIRVHLPAGTYELQVENNPDFVPRDFVPRGDPKNYPILWLTTEHAGQKVGFPAETFLPRAGSAFHFEWA
jgi:hypothetical protein